MGTNGNYFPDELFTGLKQLKKTSFYTFHEMSTKQPQITNHSVLSIKAANFPA